jgi:hypothetical protein
MHFYQRKSTQGKLCKQKRGKKIKSSKFVVKQQKVFWKKLQLELRIAILT